jgi:hypothetical protein
MGDNSTPLDSHQEAGDDAQTPPGVGDDGQIADGGAELPEIVIVDVVGEKATNAMTESIADQQVQHLSHFLFISVISFFFLPLSFFYIASPSSSWKHYLVILLVVLEGR